MSSDHGHAHHATPTRYPTLRTRALESLLVEKGLVSSDAIDALVETYEHKIGPRLGAKVAARAWLDPAFKQRLLADGNSAISELGITPVASHYLVIVENTPRVHNVIVCTLCSCYPMAVLGLPPTWYKSAPYRSRVVREPRQVLREFGLELDADVEIRVHDSTAEMRYMVLPERPAGTEHMSEEELAAIIPRDALIGTAKVQVPAASAAGR